MRLDEFRGIQMIRDTLHCGSIFIRTRRDKSNPQAELKILAISEIVNIVIPILDKYPLRMKKQRDYKIWREAAMLIHMGGHLNSHRGYVLELKRMLSEVRKYREPDELEES